MKRSNIGLANGKDACIAVGLICLLVFTLAIQAQGDQYEVIWSTIGGGEMFSTGGQYGLDGTVGQPEAGTTLSGGDYTLAGGFWPGIEPVCGDAQHPYVRGDMNRDCYVNWADFTVFAAMWLSSGCTAPNWCGGADMNRDGSVNWGDFTVFAANWLKCTAPECD